MSKKQAGLSQPGKHVTRSRFVIPMVAALWAAPLHAQSVDLTPNQVRSVASAALQAGDLRLAGAATEALLSRFPDDPNTLLIRAEVAVLVNDNEGAVGFGQRAFWNAISDEQRFAAARLIAVAHANAEQFSRSQVWLRAARQFAPNDAAANAVAQDFRTVRNQNPLSVDLRFGIAPSTNVNNGSTNSRSQLFGIVDENGNPFIFDLSEDAQALSGWEISTSVNLSYRLHTDATSATFFQVNASGRTFRLTEGSRDRLDASGQDDVDGSDFSSATFGFGLNHRFILAPDAGLTTANVSLSQSWSGGELSRRFLTTSLSHTFTLPNTDRLTVSGFSQQQERLDNGERVQVFDVGVNYSRNFEDFGNVSFGLGVRDNAAQNEGEDFGSIRYNLGFSPADAFYGVNFGFSLSYEERNFDNVPLAGGERDDEITTLSARAVFSDVEFFGFQPVVTAERTAQESTNALFDRDFTSIGFDIVSAF